MKKIAILIALSLVFVVSNTYFLYSKSNSDQLLQPLKTEEGKFFPDEYSELDENENLKDNFDEEFHNSLEISRRKYMQALTMVQKGDTIQASKYFEEAIKELNLLFSYPDIEDNDDFVELTQFIIEDYEHFVQDIKYLDEDSPLFRMKDLLYKEIESIDTLALAGSTFIQEEDESYNLQPGLIPAPDSLIIPLDDNELVDRNIKFLTQHRIGSKRFTRWLARSSKYFPMMIQIAKEEGMPQEIIYLSMIESALVPTAVSRAKAVGLWQFMRSTGEMYGLNKDKSIWIDERRDPEKATRAAMRLLRDLYNEYGDWHLAMAAYNCGEGCVNRAIRRTRIKEPSFWDVRLKLPRETRHYVPLYIATARLAMEPQKFGIRTDTINFQQELKYDLFPVDTAVNLTALAKACGISLDELRDYNPELIRGCTPPNYGRYQVKIPYGSFETVAYNFSILTDEEKAPFLVHTVSRGESISLIANKYKVSKYDLVDLNDINSTRSRLNIGDELIIPIDPHEWKELVESGAVSGQSEENVYHTVRSGESLYSIANRYGLSLNQLRSLNGFSSRKSILHVGQSLLVAEGIAQEPNNDKKATQDIAKNEETPKAKQSERRVLENENETNTPVLTKHRVKRGENLNMIAQKYGTSINQIKKDNNISGSKIYAGQLLKVRTNAPEEYQATNNDLAQEEEEIIVHKVQRGENLNIISKKYGVSQSDLKSWNPNVIKGNTVYYNTRIKIYKSAASVAPEYYSVRKGDTLNSIARKFGTSVTDLKSKNDNINARKLQVGQKIRVK